MGSAPLVCICRQEKNEMFNGRMLNIIRYLKEHGEATYKEMAKALGISERSIWSACRR